MRPLGAAGILWASLSTGPTVPRGGVRETPSPSSRLHCPCSGRGEVGVLRVLPPTPVQVNLLRRMKVTGVVTQGASRAGRAEYVKMFKVAYSLDGKKFKFIQEDGNSGDKVRPHGPGGRVLEARVTCVIGPEGGLPVCLRSQKLGNPDYPMFCGYK